MAQNDDYYYQALAVMDRIDETVQRKMNSRQFSLRMGNSSPWWSITKDRNCLSLPNILKAAEVLDVDVAWLLDGKDKAPYRKAKIDFSKMLQVYAAGARAAELSHCRFASVCISSRLSYLRKGVSKTLALKTLLELADICKISAFDAGYSYIKE